MALVTRPKRTPKPEPETETVNLTTPAELIGLLREKILEVVKEGLASHEAAQARLDIVAIVDELDLTLHPPKKA